MSTYNGALEMSTEIFQLFRYDACWDPNQLELIPVGPPSPAQTVTFNIMAGTGRAWDGSPSSDMDKAYIAWTGGGLPIADLKDANECEADRLSARGIYRELKALGYQPHLRESR